MKLDAKQSSYRLPYATSLAALERYSEAERQLLAFMRDQPDHKDGAALLALCRERVAQEDKLAAGADDATPPALEALLANKDIIGTEGGNFDE